MIPFWMVLALAQESEPVAEEPAGELTAETVAGPERSTPPGVVPAEWIDLDEPELHDLGGGSIAWHVRIPGVRKVELAIDVHAGSYELDGWPTELATQSMNLADVGTATHDPVALEIETDLHDVDIWSWIGHHGGGVSVSAPREQLAKGLELAREILHEPAFPKRDVKQRLRDKRLWYTVSGPTSLRSVAGSALAYAWYPADHPYGARPDLAAMKKLKTSDLIAKQAAWRTAGPVTVLVVGDLAFAEVEAGVREVILGLGTVGERPDELDYAAPSASRVIAVDMPGQQQVGLRLRLAAPSRLHEDHVAFDALNWVLGGHFLSRLNANLREDKGYTYGSRSSYSAADKAGTVTVSVDVKAENAAGAMREIRHELDRLVDEGVTAEELDMARQSFVSDWNGTRETAGSARGFYDDRLSNEETVSDARARAEALEGLASDAVQAVAKAWLADAPRVWVVVGDRSVVQPQLEELGLEAEWIDPSQAVLGW